MNNPVPCRIGFGGGCHWCTEAVFMSLRGVARVEQGFISSTPPDDTLSEAVVLHFDAKVIKLETLIEVHLHTHSSTSEHHMRSKYRSAVYTFDDRQQAVCNQALLRIQDDFARPLITRVLPFQRFQASEARYQNYFYNNPDKPFCESWIHPKLQLIREQFAHVYASDVELTHGQS